MRLRKEVIVLKPNLLKAKLAEKGITAKSMCKDIEMPYTTWYTKVSGRQVFNVEEVKKITKVLNLSSEEMISIFF